ncbi:hypothetical protein L596_001444 [Steinernema carpocapsae]|uniref:Uncharacterized protein n=1 Tax=Steinernema carpocapsae TaxID=34508 RepID=A0A4U8ULT0_STECR|nr:hypothetical protein L596_001444 [Steinernema carpocapsae]
MHTQHRDNSMQANNDAFLKKGAKKTCLLGFSTTRLLALRIIRAAINKLVNLLKCFFGTDHLVDNASFIEFLL